MKVASCAVAYGVALLLIGSTAAVKARGGGRGGGGPPQACAVDLKSLCAGITPGEGRIRACLMSRMSDVSAACSTKLTQAIYVAIACEDDVKQFCGNVQSGRNRIATCMKPHLREVSDTCKGALAFIAVPGNNP